MFNKIHCIHGIHCPLQFPYMTIYNNTWQWRTRCALPCKPRNPHLPCCCPHRKLKIGIKFVVVALLSLQRQKSWLVAEVVSLINCPLFVIGYVAKEGLNTPSKCGCRYVDNGEIDDLWVLGIVLESGGECFDGLCSGSVVNKYV
jgi:hypothetical protein